MGYHRAGFDVVGVDISPMRDYPFEFHQADALEYLAEHGREFDFIHASPPCQRYSAMQHIWKNKEEHPDLIVPTRRLLVKSGKPYVIENVVGSALINPIMLCGTMFGLKIIRHRIFESNFPVHNWTMTCSHTDVYDPWHSKNNKKDANKFRAAMGIDWMKDSGGGKRRGTLSQAIPPAYTEFIGRQFLGCH